MLKVLFANFNYLFSAFFLYIFFYITRSLFNLPVGIVYLILLVSFFIVILPKFNYSYLLKINFLSYAYLFVFFASFFLSLHDSSFSYYHFLKSHIFSFFIPIVFFLMFGFNLSNKFIDSLFLTLSYFIALILFLYFIDVIFTSKFSIYFIERFVSDRSILGRVYLEGQIFGFAAISFLVLYRRFFFAIFLYSIYLLTFGKIALFTGLLPFLLLFRDSYFQKYYYYSLYFISFLIPLIFWFDSSFFGVLSDNRSYQVSTALSSLNLSSLLLGNGFGNIILNPSWYEYSIDPLYFECNYDRLWLTAPYEIENGYAYLLSRSGVLGYLLFIISLFNIHFKGNFVIYLLVLSSFFGTSFVGPASLFTFCLFPLLIKRFKL